MKTTLAALVLLAAQSAFAFADQTVPVPGDLQQPPATSIQVTGVPGAGQEGHKFAIISLQLNASGKIKRGTGTEYVGYELNQVAAVKPGKYLVDYFASLAVVDVAEGQRVVLPLQKLSVPKVDGSYSFQVFMDLTNHEMQSRKALWTWLSGVALDFQNENTTTNRWGRVTSDQSWTDHKDLAQICREARSSLGKLGRIACRAYASDDYHDMIGTFYRFNADGTDSFTNVEFKENDADTCYETTESRDKEDRQYIATGIDGDFVSLLPGTYGLAMTNSAGVTKLKLGVTLP